MKGPVINRDEYTEKFDERIFSSGPSIADRQMLPLDMGEILAYRKKAIEGGIRDLTKANFIKALQDKIKQVQEAKKQAEALLKQLRKNSGLWSYQKNEKLLNKYNKANQSIIQFAINVKKQGTKMGHSFPTPSGGSRFPDQVAGAGVVAVMAGGGM